MLYAHTDIFNICHIYNRYGWNGHLPFYGRCPLWHRRHHWHYRIFHRLFYQWKDDCSPKRLLAFKQLEGLQEEVWVWSHCIYIGDLHICCLAAGNI